MVNYLPYQIIGLFRRAYFMQFLNDFYPLYIIVTN